MYKAPIELVPVQRAKYKINTDEMVMEAVLKTGINVDKDELIRALQYERCQYDKGHADGKAEVTKDIFDDINAIKKEYSSGNIDGNELYVRLYMLEKKYTEGET